MHGHFAFFSVLPPKKISTLVAASLRHVARWQSAAHLARNDCVWGGE
jgi:hypothetical protein